MNQKTLHYVTYLIGVLTIASLGFFGASAVLADTTYYYVTANEEIATVTADSSTMALNTAPNIKYNSGVIAADGLFGQGGDYVTADSDTYLYVDASGNIDTESAASASAALNQTDVDARYNSGVIAAQDYYELAGEDVTTTANGMNTYAYVTANGNMEYVTAMNAEAALNQATDIRYNSGVILVNE
jgi:hypothetical protein